MQRRAETKGFRILRLPIFLLTIPFLVPHAAYADMMDELRDQYEEALRFYDEDKAETAFKMIKVYADVNGGEARKLLLAKAALLVAELYRLKYESEDMGILDRGDVGDRIDEAARTGLDALENLPDSSERWRIESDLYATMIRSKFKGKRYGDEMEEAADKALELDPDNPNAYVTACRRYLFAAERHGGDLEKALNMLNKALDLDPNHERALVFRGTAYEKLGRLEDAKKDWIHVLDMNPHSHLAISNLNRVKGED